MSDRFFANLEKPKYPHLVRPGGGLSGEIYDLREDISRGFNRVDLGTASATGAEMQVWVHAQDGDDDNDGLTLATAKKTIQAGMDTVPTIVNHNVSLNLRGVFTDFAVSTFEAAWIERVIAADAVLVIDGGPEYNTVAGPWTADISSASTIGLSTLSLTPDEHAGKFILIEGGTHVDKVVFINKHDSTTFSYIRDLSGGPGNVQFRVIEPATVLASPNNLGYFVPSQLGSGWMAVQRLKMTGKARVYPYGNVKFGGVIISDTIGGSDFIFRRSDSGISAGFYILDPETFAYNFDYQGGFSCDRLVTISAGRVVIIYGAYLAGGLNANSVGELDIAMGSRIKGAELSSIGKVEIRSVSGFGSPIIDGASSAGLKISNSIVDVEADVTIENNTTHGIEVKQSSVKFLGDVKGSGNSGAGIFVGAHSSLETKSGDQPTITGTLGDCTIDGSAGLDLGSGISAFWTDIESGSKVDADLAANKKYALVEKV